MELGQKNSIRTKFNPKVSIVMPVFNGSDYLQEEINSVLAQT
jgi:glycosyltransferase involved in cell wall biosynthesis